MGGWAFCLEFQMQVQCIAIGSVQHGLCDDGVPHKSLSLDNWWTYSANESEQGRDARQLVINTVQCKRII
jgi:hypothetical protein